MSDLAAWERMEAEWEAKVETSVARMEALALVRVVRLAVEHRQRELAAAEYDVRKALERAGTARNNLNAARSTLEAAIRLSARDG